VNAREKRLFLILALTGLGAILARRDVRTTIQTETETAMARVTQNTSANEAKFAPVIAAAEIRNGIPAGMLHRLIRTESSFRSDVIYGTRKSPVGAVGIAQFMPATAKEWGVDPLDPVSSINGAARYLAWLAKYFGGDWKKAVASYNWGIGNVAKASARLGAQWTNALPAETRNYVAKVYA